MTRATESVWNVERAPEPEDRERPRALRCAIYTRKSSEEGLDRDCNSLEVQREAAEAFVDSRQAEGWTVVPERYDDGGYSGADRTRPALQRLLADIEAGEIDCVVVYKLDRLTRSIVDFAHTLEVLDAHGAGFVSITQQFDTTRPMRGLMVNMLLAFAQFERELMAERAARGKWHALRKGGLIGSRPMLGYVVHPHHRRLIVDDREAEQVRTIFELYLEKRAVASVAEELKRRGWRTKRQASRTGTEWGGGPFDKQGIFRVLRCPLYIGKVRVQGELHPSGHEPIMDEEVWQRTQQVLRGYRAGVRRSKYQAVLRGLLHCDVCGAPMKHHAVGPAKGYCYYACVAEQRRVNRACPAGCLPAAEVERRVLEPIRGLQAESHPAAEAVRRAREQCEATIRRLEQRRQAVLEDLQQLHVGLRARLAAVTSPGEQSAEQLPALQASVQRTEERMRSLRRELVTSHRELLDARDVQRAMSIFDPDWAALGPTAKWSNLQLLIERVGYDARTCEIVVQFRAGVMPGVPDLRIRLEAGTSGRSGRRRRLRRPRRREGEGDARCPK